MPEYWEGLSGMVAATKKVRDAKTAGGVKGIRLALRNTLDVSNSQVPHEEGDLERDGGTSVDEKQMRGAIAYGRRGDTKDYAVVQHEDMTLHHDSGRNAKYLENAINSTRSQNLQIIGQAIKKELGG